MDKQLANRDQTRGLELAMYIVFIDTLVVITILSLEKMSNLGYKSLEQSFFLEGVWVND